MSGKSSKKTKKEEPLSALGQGLFVLFLLPCMIGICVFLFDAQSHDSRYLIQLSNTLPDMPDGMPGAEQIRAELEQAIRREQPVSIFDNNLESVVRQVYESNPFISRVTSYERRFPGNLKVGVEFRQPIAAVETDGRYVLVDQHGDLLPIEVSPDQVVPPTISVHPACDLANDPGSYDEDWFLAAVKEGVAVLLDLEDNSDNDVFDAVNIVGIDISNHGGRLDERLAEISLVVDRGWFDAKSGRQRNTVLAWGRSTKHPKHLMELAVSHKLENLKRVLLARPSGLRGVRLVDLRFDEAYYRED